MKNIVVGIDFSKNSLNALKHAVAIGLKTKGTLHLVWVKTPAVSNEIAKKSASSYTKRAEEYLQHLKAECKAEAPHCGVNCVILEGKPAYELTKFAANLQDSILVMGTHGVSGFEEAFIGSNAYKTIGLTEVPVLIIRENIEINRDLTQILVPIDSSFETLQKMKPAIKFAKAFSAKLLLLGINTSEDPMLKHTINVQLGHAGNMCTKANVRHDVHTIAVKTNSSKAVIDYAQNVDVNLVVIMREEEEDMTNFWMGSTTRMMINTSPVPMLIIPNVNHFAVSK